MNKQITTVITAALILINLTACSAGAEPKGDSPDNSSGLSVPVSDNSENKTESSSGTESGSENSGISESNSSGNAPETGIAAPDGSILNESEAVSADDILTFDHSYIRYAKPVFYNTLDNPGLINWDTMEFSVDQNAAIEEPNYFKVKAGDKLENDLTVKRASYAVSREGFLMSSMVFFEGEITLEGILYCESQDNIYFAKGHLQFWADPTKYNLIPIACGSDYAIEQVDCFVEPEDKTAFVFDGKLISLGILGDVTVDLSGTISYGECIKAKVTLKNLREGWSDGNGSKSTAALVSVERLSD